MLSVGIGEIALIALVVLLVVGPDDLPRVLREVGRRYGQFRRAADDLRRAMVLEADRQDAEDRFQELQARRLQAAEEQDRALKDAGEGAVAQERTLRGEQGEEIPPDVRDIAGFEDPYLPAHRPPPPVWDEADTGQASDLLREDEGAPPQGEAAPSGPGEGG